MPTLGEIAEFLGARLLGDAAFEIEGLAELKSAGPSFLSFLANPKYAGLLEASTAGALLVGAADAARPELKGRRLLVSPNPYRDFARTLRIRRDRLGIASPGAA